MAGGDGDPADFGDVAKETKPHPEIRFSEGPAYLRDPAFYRKVVQFLGWCLVLCLVGATISYLCSDEVPQIFTAIGSGIVGVFAGVMVASKQGA